MRSHSVYLIDASIYIFRYYFTLPDHWHSRDNFSTAAVYGYTMWLIRLLRSQRPVQVAACFDESLESCFRNQIYPHYKCSRALPDAALAFQLSACKQITELMGIPTYASPNFEADDLIGTLAHRIQKKKLGCTIVSRDKDLGQLLVNKTMALWDFPDGLTMGPLEIKQKWGVHPHQIADYLALVGDPGDDIPGVPSIGAKTAVSLLTAFGSWAQIKTNLDKVECLPLRGAGTIAKRLIEYRQQVDMAIQLSRIQIAAPLGRKFSVTRRKLNPKLLCEHSDYLGFGRRFHTSVAKLMAVL